MDSRRRLFGKVIPFRLVAWLHVLYLQQIQELRPLASQTRFACWKERQISTIYFNFLIYFSCCLSYLFSLVIRPVYSSSIEGSLGPSISSILCPRLASFGYPLLTSSITPVFCAIEDKDFYNSLSGNCKARSIRYIFVYFTIFPALSAFPHTLCVFIIWDGHWFFYLELWSAILWNRDSVSVSSKLIAEFHIHPIFYQSAPPVF